MTLASIGSLVYLILAELALLVFVLINCLAFPPVTGAKDSNDTAAISKTDGEYAPVNLAETKVAFLLGRQLGTH
jgi:hypothetical protein